MKNLLLVLLIAIPIYVFADRVTKKTQTTILFSGDGSPIQALAANRNRKGLIISDNGADAIFIQFGSSSANGNPQNLDAMKLAANTAYEFQNVPMDAIWIKGAASTGTRRVGIIEFE